MILNIIPILFFSMELA